MKNEERLRDLLLETAQVLQALRHQHGRRDLIDRLEAEAEELNVKK